jgi:hypothetical protein
VAGEGEEEKQGVLLVVAAKRKVKPETMGICRSPRDWLISGATRQLSTAQLSA